MKNVSYAQIFELSLQRTKQLLLSPFSIKRWLKLLFIVMTAAQLTGGGGSVKDSVEFFRGKTFEKEASAAVDEASAPSKTSADVLQEFKKDVIIFWDQHQSDPMFRVIVGAGLILIILLIIFLMWLSARFNFIWLSCLLTADVVIKKPFQEYRKEGWSLFLFEMISYSLILIMVILGAIWLYSDFGPLSVIQDKISLGWQASLKMVLGVVFLVALILACGFFMFYISHLVTPIMTLKRIGIVAAWKEFKLLFKAHGSDMFLFPLIFAGFSILTRMIGLFFFMLIGVVGLLIGGLVGGVLYFLFNNILFIQYAGNIVLIVLGVSWLAVLILILALSQMPFAVFLRYFTLHFLGSLDPAYQLEITSSKHQITNNL